MLRLTSVVDCIRLKTSSCGELELSISSLKSVSMVLLYMRSLGSVLLGRALF